MTYRDLTSSVEIDEARHQIDRALLDGEATTLAAWAREWGRPAVEALRSLKDASERSGRWDYG